MKKVRQIEKQLAILRAEFAATICPDRRQELGEKIDFLQDEVDEIEEAIADEYAYEEMTGTTPQDLYIERNSYAIRQGEAIERFRNEY